jgi:hypothetical protein
VATSCQTDSWKASHCANGTATARRPCSASTAGSTGAMTMRRRPPSSDKSMVVPVSSVRAMRAPSASVQSAQSRRCAVSMKPPRQV